MPKMSPKKYKPLSKAFLKTKVELIHIVLAVFLREKFDLSFYVYVVLKAHEGKVEYEKMAELLKFTFLRDAVVKAITQAEEIGLVKIKKGVITLKDEIAFAQSYIDEDIQDHFKQNSEVSIKDAFAYGIKAGQISRARTIMTCLLVLGKSYYLTRASPKAQIRGSHKGYGADQNYERRSILRRLNSAIAKKMLKKSTRQFIATDVFKGEHTEIVQALTKGQSPCTIQKSGTVAVLRPSDFKARKDIQIFDGPKITGKAPFRGISEIDEQLTHKTKEHDIYATTSVLGYVENLIWLLKENVQDKYKRDVSPYVLGKQYRELLKSEIESTQISGRVSKATRKALKLRHRQLADNYAICKKYPELFFPSKETLVARFGTKADMHEADVWGEVAKINQILFQEGVHYTKGKVKKARHEFIEQTHFIKNAPKVEGLPVLPDPVQGTRTVAFTLRQRFGPMHESVMREYKGKGIVTIKRFLEIAVQQHRQTTGQKYIYDKNPIQMITDDGYEILGEKNKFAAPVKHQGNALVRPVAGTSKGTVILSHIYIKNFVGGEILASPSGSGENARGKNPDQELEISKYFYKPQEQAQVQAPFFRNLL
jgi:hypothetical protein